MHAGAHVVSIVRDVEGVLLVDGQVLLLFGLDLSLDLLLEGLALHMR